MSNSLPSSPVRTFQDYKIYSEDDNNYTNGNLMIGEPMLNNNNNSNRPIVHTMTSLSIGLSASEQKRIKSSSNRSILRRTVTNPPINKSIPYYDSNKKAAGSSLLHENTIRNLGTTSYDNSNNNLNSNNANGSDNTDNTTFATIGDNSYGKSDPMLQKNARSSSNNSNKKKNINNNDNNDNTNTNNINTSNVSPQNGIKKSNVNVLKTIQSSSRPLYNYVNNEDINGMLNFDVSTNHLCILSIFFHIH